MRSKGNWMMLLAACAVGLAGGTAARAAQETTVRAVVTQLKAVPVAGETEEVQLDPALPPTLLKLRTGSSVAVADWPVSPGVRQEVELTRVEVYAPGAKIVKVENGRTVELPRSRHVFFQGRSVDDPETRLVVAVDPDTLTLEGTALTGQGPRELRPAKSGGYVVSTAEELEKSMGQKPSWSCGQEQSAQARELTDVFGPAPTKGNLTLGEAVTTLETATIAVDTDNELLSQKFSNSTTAATNYIANLFAAMNVIYERDLQVRLLQGLTILRPSTTADPYAQGPGFGTCTACANGNQLNEFSNYWSGGCGGACTGAAANRALAVMLSGKSTSANLASGIASVGTLCSTASGYSFNQVFKFAQDTVANDIMVVAHEIGHNFGSPHTHCYSPPIDTCYNGEACYTGAQSCPATQTINGVTNVTGTLMSYCHLSGLAGCGSSPVFHPRTVSLVATNVTARVGVCFFPLGGTNSLFGDGFEAGTTVSWQ